MYLYDSGILFSPPGVPAVLAVKLQSEESLVSVCLSVCLSLRSYRFVIHYRFVISYQFVISYRFVIRYRFVISYQFVIRYQFMISYHCMYCLPVTPSQVVLPLLYRQCIPDSLALRGGEQGQWMGRVYSPTLPTILQILPC